MVRRTAVLGSGTLATRNPMPMPSNDGLKCLKRWEAWKVVGRVKGSFHSQTLPHCRSYRPIGCHVAPGLPPSSRISTEPLSDVR